MAYSTNLANAGNFFQSNKNTATKEQRTVYARVLDVILDSEHPDYENYGRKRAINGIKYKLVEESGEIVGKDSFAYCEETFIKRVPLVDEIVEIVSAVSNSENSKAFNKTKYYRYPINTWNSSHHNALPTKIVDTTEARLGDNVIEKIDIANLQPFPGDFLIEGRLGSSLRLSGYSHSKNIFTDTENNGKPFSILRIGQAKDIDTFENYTEDVNKDASSIYLMSEHKVPVEVSTVKKDTYRNQDIPVGEDVFKQNQVIIDSGRILLHSKSDHLLLNSKNSIGLSGLSTNIDSIDYISLDSPKIYLGSSATEPVLRGNKSVELINNLIETLLSVFQSHDLAITPDLASTQLVAAASEATPKLLEIKNELETLKSKKVFTE